MPANAFYGPFDTATLEGRAEPDYRSEFQRDRDRIIHSAPFRRLQAKTQVFLVGEGDFYRTRLTHSIEVAQIGRSICNRLQHACPELSTEFHVDPDLVEAVCLAHDLGHPPFGHVGERALNDCMTEFGGFEGNAQTLRLIARTLYPRPGGQAGMKPTRAFADGVMKYKRLFEPGMPARFLYRDQADLLTFVCGGPPEDVADLSAQPASIECQIMDWADDTAYSLYDVVDGVHAGLIETSGIRRWLERPATGEWAAAAGIDGALLVETAREVIRLIDAGALEAAFSGKVGTAISACRLVAAEPSPLARRSHRYQFALAIDPDVRATSRVHKQLARDLVFASSQLQQLDHKWRLILVKLFDVLRTNYFPGGGEQCLLPEPFHTLVVAEPRAEIKARWICDHLAGMSDGYAIRFYRRLFDPDYGSLIDHT